VTANVGRLRRLFNRVLSDDPLVRATALQSAIFAFGHVHHRRGRLLHQDYRAYGGRGRPWPYHRHGVAVPGLHPLRAPRRPDWRTDLLGIGNALQTVAFLGWLFVHGFWSFIAVVVGREVTAQLGQIGWSTYRLAAFPRETSVRSGAYNRAALNVGFTVGALVGGVALATGSLTVIRFIRC
jgi:hypothetical protein